ncbi:Uncharacterized protein FWK35_00005624, partial [Aphis craccivora]
TQKELFINRNEVWFQLLIFTLKLLDSERSDECIDFTMMCVFYFYFYFLFLCLSPRFGAWTLFLISNVRKNPKKVTEKQEFLRKTSFRPNRFFYMVVNQKLITTIKIFDFYENSNFYEICRKRENLQRNDLNYFISRRYLKRTEIFNYYSYYFCFYIRSKKKFIEFFDIFSYNL